MQEEVSVPEVRRQEDSLRRKQRVATVYRRRRVWLAVALVALCLVIVGIVIAATAGHSTPQISAQALMAGETRSPSAPVATDGDEHPAFARLDDRNLLLPVDADDATIIAYQAVSDERAITLSPIGDKVNTNALVRFFRDIFSGEPSVRYYQLDGADGEPTTSVLVGAAPGSPVTAPISGVVTWVEEYKLFGEYDDVRIDIRPENMGDVTISLLFISDPVVSIGESVTAGKTQLGKVRQCPQELAECLQVYTYDSGSHVCMLATGEPVN